VGDITPQSLSASGTGAVFGGQLGYNWQTGSWVLGVEGDFDGTGISGTQKSVFASLLTPSNTDGFTATEKANWLASARGRVGYTWGPGLLYATGGGAWESVTRNSMVSANTGNNVFGDSAAGSFTTTKSGWVAGAGYEWMMAANWTVRGEYLFYKFSNSDTDSLTLPNCPTPTGCGVNVSNSLNQISVFRLGVNYRF